MPFRSTKTFCHSLGFSTAFRQWKADSHCKFLHGYALEIRIEFEAYKLDDRDWVIDFGGLRDLKQELIEQFDHKLLVAQDDPAIEFFKTLHSMGIADVRFVKSVGCESFAALVFSMAWAWLRDINQGGRVRVALVEVKEHGGNSAVYIPEH